MHPSLITRFHAILSEIDNARQQSDTQQAVTLLAVSKTKPWQDILTLYEAGQRHFGENYVQELVDKATQGALHDIQWHFIGAIQSNKTQAIATYASWVHSIDRLKIARRLSEQRPAHLPPLHVCVQINIDDEPQKAGVAPSEAAVLIQALHALPHFVCVVSCVFLSLKKINRRKQQNLLKYNSFTKVCSMLFQRSIHYRWA